MSADRRLPPWTLGILAGGRSSRFGGDKALARFGSATLIEHVAEHCRNGASEVLVSVRSREQPLPPALDGCRRLVDDAPAFSGPLAGIIALMEASRTDWLAVVACDMPSVSSADLETLLEAATLAGHRHMRYRLADGTLAPLPAVYHRSLIGDSRRRFASGDRRIVAFEEGMPTLEERRSSMLLHDATRCRSINTPADLDAARAATNGWKLSKDGSDPAVDAPPIRP